ncbi:MAG: hypothetical protein CMO01_28650 [Thalassobius sp.]|nr:hypothetical protein [Thalassovita sp.]
MKSSIKPLAIIIISIFGFLIIISHYADRSKLKLSAKEIQLIARSTNYTIDQKKLNEFQNPVLIDLREPKFFNIDHQEKAVNIPLSEILNEEYENLFASETPKLIQAHDQVKANEAWMLLTQLGYKNLYVVEL